MYFQEGWWNDDVHLASCEKKKKTKCEILAFGDTAHKYFRQKKIIGNNHNISKLWGFLNKLYCTLKTEYSSIIANHVEDLE